ncbi:glycoside hydrolase family 39 protein [Thozetella sp. PMI_491]|nr:glycoside hydrolase family 39 protein [Thozetella sp. PMI_491]
MLSLIQALLVVCAGAVVRAQATSTTATVDLGSNLGTPQHLASGFIYGIPDNYPNQIPGSWYTGIDFNYGRAGGAQLPAPNRGWIWGLNEYKGRFASTKANYQTTRAYGGNFIILPHDIWGTDNSNASTVWPGTNGDWTDYDKFLTQLKNDLVANNMLAGLVWDIWNEPDLTVFWKGTQQQWISLYIRTHQNLRADTRFSGVKISGPTLASQPVNTNTWWTNWLSQIAAANTVPDQWAYHLEGGINSVSDPQYTNASLGAMLKTYGLPGRETNINEYAVPAEQVPSGYAWWIARLERYNFWGLLGNWMSGTELHDMQANLLTKPSPATYASTAYEAAAGWWVYRYYAQNMTGVRLATVGSTDGVLDVYATRDSSKVRLLVGTRTKVGTWQLQVNNLAALGYQASGSVTISTWGFLGSSNIFDAQPAPTFRNTVTHAYTGGSLTFPIYQTEGYTAWAFEFAVL